MARCPGCGRCQQCGQPWPVTPYPYPIYPRPFVPYPYPTTAPVPWSTTLPQTTSGGTWQAGLH